jgi:acetylglutamate kinase
VLLDRIVLKVGGSELAALSRGEDGDFVAGLIAALRALRKAYAVALVHGGGPAIARLQERLHLEPRFVEGLRVTDDASLDVAEMVLSGWVNKRLVARLVSAGVPAMGLSGVDNGLLRVVKVRHLSGDLGWVGEIAQTCPAEVVSLLARGVMPVISPISLGLDGRTYNVNADHAASALACALGAAELVFVSNVPGVLVGASATGVSAAGRRLLPGTPYSRLTATQAETLIAGGEIKGGMIPKVRSALAALERGVPQVRIVDLEGLTTGGGTRFQVG